MVTNPMGTLEGAASGIGSLFNRATKTVGQRKSGEGEDSSFEQVVGISKSKGKIASSYGVNVYSNNKFLQQELDRLGQADFLGGLGVGVATSFVPGVGGIVLSTTGAARLLNDTINTTPASELWLQNKKKLATMGINEDTAELFLNNPVFNPARSTVFVASLESMPDVKNRALLVKVALQASDSTMAEVITRTAIMTAAYNKKIAPIKKLVPMARFTQAIGTDGKHVIMLPTDYLIWSERIANAVAAISRDDQNSKYELWVLGTVSPLAESEFKQLGSKIYTNTGKQLLPKKK